MLNALGYRLLTSIPLFFGVTILNFVLMVYFGPDQTYLLLGKNPTAQDIAHLHQHFGYDLPFWQRYLDFLREIVQLDFGHSLSNYEPVDALLWRTIPVSLAVSVPGFIVGHAVALALGLVAAYSRGWWPDQAVTLVAAMGMSTSLLTVIILFQIIFCSHGGLDLFPIQGWNVTSLASYGKYVTIPTLCLAFVAVGYNTRFYRAVLVEQMGRDHVLTARAFGCPPVELLLRHVLRSALVPILARLLTSVPLVLIGGSMLVETFFNIPGVGSATYDAITSGDLPVLKAIVCGFALTYIAVIISTDFFFQLADPRVKV